MLTRCVRPIRASKSLRAHIALRSFCTPAQNHYLSVFGEACDYKLAIPLPGLGPRVFSLSGRQKVSSLIQNIQLEDLSVVSVKISDPTGAIISRNTTTEELLQQDWVLRLNQTPFHVKSPPLAKEGLDAAQSHPRFQQTLHFFHAKAEESSYLTVSEYTRFTEDHGISDQQASQFLEAANEAGIILHLPGNIELGQTIFLRPSTIAKALDPMLQFPRVSQSREEKKVLLAKYKAELKIMEELKKQCVERADVVAHRIAIAGFVGLCTQFCIFARLTWWESDWDVMEPITYFTTVLESVLLGQFWFLWAGDEFAHMGLRQALLQWQLAKQYKKNDFSPEKLKQLKNKIDNLVTEIHFEKPRQPR